MGTALPVGFTPGGRNLLESPALEVAARSLARQGNDAAQELTAKLVGSLPITKSSKKSAAGEWALFIRLRTSGCTGWSRSSFYRMRWRVIRKRSRAFSGKRAPL